MSGFSISLAISLIHMPSNSAAKIRINGDSHNRLKVEFFTAYRSVGIANKSDELTKCYDENRKAILFGQYLRVHENKRWNYCTMNGAMTPVWRKTCTTTTCLKRQGATKRKSDLSRL